MEYVYVIESPTGRYYVGSTKNYTSRKGVHLHHLRRGTHESRRVQAEWDAHGPLTIRPFAQPLPGVPLLHLEQQAIDDAFLAGLALNSGRFAVHPNIGRPMSQEQREQLSRDRKGIPLTPEKLARRRELMADKPNPMQGKTQTAATRQKISERHKAAYAAGRVPSQQDVGRPIRGEKDGEVRHWLTARAFCRDIGVSNGYPSQRIGTGKPVKGWVLTYE